MGSFAAHVDLPDGLRSWAGSGLELLFLPGGIPAPQPLQIAATEPPAQAPSGTSHVPAEVAPGRAGQGDTTPDSPHDDAQAQPVWPAPWSVLASRVRTPPKVIITYASLASDLSGAADPARRKLFQNVLGYLAWPAGTTLFWPLFYAKGAEPPAEFAADHFASGVQHFKVRHLLCFGAASVERASILFLQEGPTSPVLVHRAPDPDELVRLLPHELHQALAHLKGLSLT